MHKERGQRFVPKIFSWSGFDMKLPLSDLFPGGLVGHLYFLKPQLKIMAHSTAGILTQPVKAYSRNRAFTIATHIARVLLGLIFLVFGLNGFFHFLPMPPLTKTAGEFVSGLLKSPLLFPFMSFIQVVCGALLLSGTLVPFALLLLAPIILNIFLYHLALAPESLGMAFFILAAHILLAIYYWPAYKPIFQSNNAWRSSKS